MNKKILILLIGLALFGIVAAENIDAVNKLDDVKQNECILIPQTCASCSYLNITITHKNGTVIENQGMTNNGASWTYLFCNTSSLGRYDIQGKGDLEGVETSFTAYYFYVRNSNSFIFYTLLGLAIIFFIATLFVNEEFFVYISGVLFILSGIYMMINGLDTISDMYSRGISFVLIGLGVLFNVGAYIYNSYNKWREEDEY